MNRFEQRLQKRMQNEEFAAGYWEMDAELELIHAIDMVRKQQHITHEELAILMGKQRAKVSRLFTAEQTNPT